MGARASTPDTSGSFYYEPEFPLLVFRGEAVAHYRRSEAALRAEGKSRKRHIPAGLANPLHELFASLQPPAFCCHQAKHNQLLFRHVPERLEGARAGVIVFEQEPLRVKLLEENGRNLIVAALGEPPAVLVASA